jgi:hypothetical protein
MLDNNINKSNRPAKIHVLLSRKSEVFCTPPICWAPPPKEEDRPPPLGFCTITIRTSKKQTRIMRDINIEKLLMIIDLTLNF